MCSIQSDLVALLDARRKKPVDHEEIQKYLRFLAARLGGGDKVLSALQRFEEKADTAMWKAISILVSPKSRFSDLKTNKVHCWDLVV